MSSTTDIIEGQQPERQQAQMPIEYNPTEEEKSVFKECNWESFWYRSVPFSVVSIAVTQALIARGTISASPRFGSLPNLVFAGFFGYMTGKMSYMKKCLDKFKNLENSPLGETLRQSMGLPPQSTSVDQSELSDPNVQSFEPMLQPSEDINQEYFTESPVQMGRSGDFSAPAEPYAEEEPRRKGILYEDLRLKNRENYEVMLSQKAETLHKISPEKETRRPNKEVKNIYGDTWEE